jgi:hypothetical protein
MPEAATFVGSKAALPPPEGRILFAERPRPAGQSAAEKNFHLKQPVGRHRDGAKENIANGAGCVIAFAGRPGFGSFAAKSPAAEQADISPGLSFITKRP